MTNLQLAYFNNQELPAWVVSDIRDDTGTQYDMSTGWTFTVTLARTTAPATALFIKSSGITASATAVTVAWAASDWSGLEAAVNGTTYVVALRCTRAADSFDLYYRPKSLPVLTLKAALGTSVVSPSSLVVTVRADTVTATPSGNLAGTTAQAQLVELDAEKAPIGPLVSGLTYPSVWAHRGGANLRPEETEIAFDGALNEGMPVLDTDGRLLADGQVALFHDATVDRTTTATGNVAAFRSSDIQQMVVDASAFISPGSANTKPMLLAEWFRKYRGQAVLTIEAKDTGSCAAIIALANQMGVPKTQLIIQSFVYADCLLAVAAGFPALYLVTDLATASASQLAADRVAFVGASTNITSGTVAPFTSAGIKVGAWTYDRRNEWTTLQAAGVNFVWSNDPSWVAGTSGQGLNDPYLSKVPWPGRINTGSAGAGWQNTADYGFTAASPSTYVGTLQGWMGGITRNTYTITYQCALDSVNGGDTTRWASVLACAPDDKDFLDASVPGTFGYHCLMRANGVIALFKVVNGVTTLLQQQTIAAPTLGTKYTYKIAITPTTVTFFRNDVPGTTCSSSDVTPGRGGYTWFGRNGAAARFSDVSIA